VEITPGKHLVDLSLRRCEGEESKESSVRLTKFIHVSHTNQDSHTVANGADNASSNGPLNQKLSECLWKISKVHIDPQNMQIGCGGHVLNISAQ
jgi:hypothetical protein